MLAKDLKKAYCMPATAPAYPPPPFLYEGCRQTMIIFRTDPEVIRSLVPEPLVPDAIPILGLYIAKLSITSPNPGTYMEAGLVARVAYEGNPGMYFSHLYLDSALGVIVGREIWGFPKKPAQIIYKEEDGKISTVVTLMGGTLIKTGMQKARKLDQFPEDPIQAGYTLKIIPSAEPDAPPDVLQLVSIPHIMQVREMYEGSGTLELLPSPFDSLGNIPVLEVVGATFQVLDMTLDWGKVVVDYLTERVELESVA